ncbi:hypothetical protein GCM10023196_017100 [Actinoallomurus vinaceus]|uniref:Secreted protein n=1 Tax=Actinoallomurus vinaceus TaxID=1080074 RepID=A0ABP8U5N6_9ACTN
MVISRSRAWAFSTAACSRSRASLGASASFWNCSQLSRWALPKASPPDRSSSSHFATSRSRGPMTSCWSFAQSARASLETASNVASVIVYRRCARPVSSLTSAVSSLNPRPASPSFCSTVASNRSRSFSEAR